MTNRPRILFLSQCLPHPPHSGVRARTYNILNQLRVDFDVTLLAFSREGHHRDAAARMASERALAALLGHVEPAVPIPSEESTARRVWDHVRSLITRRPYTVFEYASEQFRAQLRDVRAHGAFDLVHIDSPDLAGWLPELPPAPVTCTHHSIESQLLRRQAGRVRSLLLRWYVVWQADLLEADERSICPGFRLNLMMSEKEASMLRTMAPGSRTAVVPNGVDVTYFAPRPDVPVVDGRVAFVGATDMWDPLESTCRHASLSIL